MCYEAQDGRELRASGEKGEAPPQSTLATSDATGSFVIQLVAPGDYIIVASVAQDGARGNRRSAIRRNYSLGNVALPSQIGQSCGEHRS